MSVRQADIDDLETVLDRWLALLEEHVDHGSRIDPDHNRAAGRELLAETIADNRVLVADDDGIVGIATVSIDDGMLAVRSRRGTIETIYVTPDRRSEGIGTELLTAAERTLADRDCSTIAVEVLAANERAREFYTDNGYGEHRLVLQREVESNTKPADEP